MKVCTKCKILKPLNGFPPDKKHKDGRASGCRVCGRAACKRWSDSHKESIAQRRHRNKDHIVAKNKERWVEKKEVLHKQHREWVAQNPEKMAAYGVAWRERDIEHARALGRKAAARRVETVTGRLNQRISNGMRQTLVRGSKGRQHWETLAGYNIAQLKRHLEKRFTPEMSWDNYGKYWHIDHKIPVAAFNFKTPDDLDFKRCWALKNLRPLEKFQNQSKGAKVDRPFQPSLAMAVQSLRDQMRRMQRPSKHERAILAE